MRTAKLRRKTWRKEERAGSEPSSETSKNIKRNVSKNKCCVQFLLPSSTSSSSSPGDGMTSANQHNCVMSWETIPYLYVLSQERYRYMFAVSSTCRYSWVLGARAVTPHRGFSQLNYPFESNFFSMSWHHNHNPPQPQRLSPSTPTTSPLETLLTRHTHFTALNSQSWPLLLMRSLRMFSRCEIPLLPHLPPHLPPPTPPVLY